MEDTLNEIRQCLTQVRIPCSSHAHSIPLHLNYLVEETPIGKEEVILRTINPSQMHSAYAILQKGPFKMKYDHITHYLQDGNLFQSYIR